MEWRPVFRWLLTNIGPRWVVPALGQRAVTPDLNLTEHWMSHIWAVQDTGGPGWLKTTTNGLSLSFRGRTHYPYATCTHLRRIRRNKLNLSPDAASLTST